MKAVYDTNVYVSGLFWDGPPRELLRKAANCSVRLFISESILKEISKVLGESFDASEDAINHAITTFARISTLVYPRESLNVVRDRKDNHILECALESNSDYIVTGDKDLLVVKEYRGIRIISPKEFLEVLNK